LHRHAERRTESHFLSLFSFSTLNNGPKGKSYIDLCHFLFQRSCALEVNLLSIDDVEQQIKALTETLTYLLRYFAQSEGLPENIAEDATSTLLDILRRQGNSRSDRAIEAAAKKALMLTARQKGIPIRDHKACFRLLKAVGANVPYSPDPYIEWICSKLGLSQNTMNKAKEIAQKYKTKTLKRGAPRVLAAASIYLASLVSGDCLNQEPIAEQAQCTAVSLRNLFHRMSEILGLGPYKKDATTQERLIQTQAEAIKTIQIQETRCWNCKFLSPTDIHELPPSAYWCRARARNRERIELVMPSGFAEKCVMFEPKNGKVAELSKTTASMQENLGKWMNQPIDSRPDFMKQ